MNNTLKAHLALFGAALIYGANYNITKIVVPSMISPEAGIFLRVICAGFLFVVLDKLTTNEKVEKKDYWLMALCAFFGVALNQMMFFKGLSITTPINASVLMVTTPILVLIVSSVIIKERITWLKLSGITLGSAGALFIIGGAGLSFSSVTFLGDIFIMVNAASYGVFLVLVKPLTQKYQPITILKWTFLFGFVFVFPFSIEDILATPFQEMKPIFWYCMAFIIFGTTFLAYLFNAYSLKYVNPTVVSIYIYLQPVFAALFSLIYGNSTLKLETIGFGLMIFLGVYLVSKR